MNFIRGKKKSEKHLNQRNIKRDEYDLCCLVFKNQSDKLEGKTIYIQENVNVFMK